MEASMKYRVKLDLILDSNKGDLANTIYNTLLTELKSYATVIKATEEHSYIQLEECYHDEGKPCVILKQTTKE